MAISIWSFYCIILKKIRTVIRLAWFDDLTEIQFCSNGNVLNVRYFNPFPLSLTRIDWDSIYDRNAESRVNVPLFRIHTVKFWLIFWSLFTLSIIEKNMKCMFLSFFNLFHPHDWQNWLQKLSTRSLIKNISYLFLSFFSSNSPSPLPLLSSLYSPIIKVQLSNSKVSAIFVNHKFVMARPRSKREHWKPNDQVSPRSDTMRRNTTSKMVSYHFIYSFAHYLSWLCNSRKVFSLSFLLFPFPFFFRIQANCSLSMWTVWFDVRISSIEAIKVKTRWPCYWRFLIHRSLVFICWFLAVV